MTEAQDDGVDFRSERMPTAEGRGAAKGALKRAWDGYSKAMSSSPLVQSLAEKIAAPVTLDLVGFWLAWHLEGGFEGLQRLGMSRASIYRRVNLFRKTMGVHPDEFRFPGVEIDLGAYLRHDYGASGGKPIADPATHPKLKSQTTDK